MALSHDTTKAIEAFISNKTNGERWRRILFEAPAYAMERIAVYFHETYYKSVLTKEDCEQIKDLCDEIDATLEREDLEYLVKVMPEPEKSRYMAMLNGMQQKAPDSSNKQLESKPIVIHCPKCNEELELPGHAIGWKVKCSYCNEKFFATEDFIRKQQEPRKGLPTIRIKRPANYMPQTHKLSEEEKLKLRAERGEAKAQYELAIKFMNGQGVAKNEAEAVKWLRKAAEQGDLNALHDMGVAYFNGLGVPVNKEEGVKWYRKAAERGNENAQYDLGICLSHGFGTAKNDEHALFWFMQAAERGRADAMYNVGICYGNGYGVKKDVNEAMKWFQKAADAGDEAAKKIVEPKVYTGDDAIKMIQKICQESDAKREAQEPPRSAASPVAAENKKEGGTTMKRNTTTTTSQHLGKGSGVDWSRENKAFAEMLAKYGIRKFHVEMVNPYCAEVSIPMTESRSVVRGFANDLFHALDILDEGYDLEFGQLTDCSGIDINDDAKCYYVLFNQHDVAECNPGDGKYKYKIEAITANGADDEEDDDSDGGGNEAEKVMQAISFGIKSGAIRSKSGEGYFVLKGEYYDAIEAGRKTTEYRDLTPRNLSLSIGIKTVKFQRGYGHPGQPPEQMRFEVASVGLLDADDRECDPYAIPPGFIATTIAIHLGKRIG